MRNEFTIEATAAAFETLSTKLYSDPRLAVVRELSTNANDANIEAGSSKSIELHVPNSNEPWFAVRDYGNGLSPEEVNLIYTSFFASTKSANNAVTGAFGLGSKSPFAVTNKFKVVSHYNGKDYVYNMEKVNGIPTCELVSESSSKEESGLYVEVPVNENSTYDWQKTIHDFFVSTKYLPSFSTEEVFGDFESYIHTREFFTNPSIEFDSSYEKKGIHVNVAGVGFLKLERREYPVVASLWKECQNLGITGINLIAEKNDVTITPSREELHFDDKTNEWLDKAFHTQVAEYFNNIAVENINLSQYLQLKKVDLIKYGTINDVVYEVSKHIDNVNANVIYLSKDHRLASGYRAFSSSALPRTSIPCYIVDASVLNGQNLKAVQNLLINRGETSSLNQKAISYLKTTTDFNADAAFFIATMKPIKTRKFLKQFGFDPKFVDINAFFKKTDKVAKVDRSLLDKFITRACLCLENGTWHDSRYIDRTKEYELFVTSKERVGYDTENQIKTYAAVTGKNVIVRPNWNKDCPEYAKVWLNHYKEFCVSEQFQEAQRLADAGANIRHELGLKCYAQDEELETVFRGHASVANIPAVKHWLEDCDFVRQNEDTYKKIRYILSCSSKDKFDTIVGSEFPMLKLEPQMQNVDDIEVIAQYIESCLLK